VAQLGAQLGGGPGAVEARQRVGGGRRHQVPVQDHDDERQRRAEGGDGRADAQQVLHGGSGVDHSRDQVGHAGQCDAGRRDHGRQRIHPVHEDPAADLAHQHRQQGKHEPDESEVEHRGQHVVELARRSDRRPPRASVELRPLRLGDHRQQQLEHDHPERERHQQSALVTLQARVRVPGQRRPEQDEPDVPADERQHRQRAVLPPRRPGPAPRQDVAERRGTDLPCRAALLGIGGQHGGRHRERRHDQQVEQADDRLAAPPEPPGQHRGGDTDGGTADQGRPEPAPARPRAGTDRDGRPRVSSVHQTPLGRSSRIVAAPLPRVAQRRGSSLRPT
jgi:hypothetical protein